MVTQKEAAKTKVENSPQLAPYADFILADWPGENTHWQWVIVASEQQILDWIESVGEKIITGNIAWKKNTIMPKDKDPMTIIPPHKGGRSIKRSTDVTPKTDAWLREQKEKHGRSLGDLIEWLAENYETYL